MHGELSKRNGDKVSSKKEKSTRALHSKPFCKWVSKLHTQRRYIFSRTTGRQAPVKAMMRQKKRDSFFLLVIGSLENGK